MNIHIFSLACRLFYRELKTKHFNIMLIALVLSITLLTTVNLYADRLHRAIYNQSSELIGGDLTIGSNVSFNSTLNIKANELQLKTAHYILFPTMARFNDQLQLVQLKAVSTQYPLRGKIFLRPNLDGQTIETKSSPHNNEIWLDLRIMQILNLKMGDMVHIGNGQFKFTHILVSEPDVSSNFMSLAPKALVNINDIAKTDILQPGSRINYMQLFAGNPQQITLFNQWLHSNTRADEKIMSAKDTSTQLTPLLNNTLSFLNLVIFICIILSGIAITAASYRFYQRQQNTAALFKCFGLTHYQVLGIYFFLLIFLGLIAGILSILLAIIFQFLISVVASYWLTLPLPYFTYQPILKGLLSSFFLLFLFSLPNFIYFKHIHTQRLLRDENNNRLKPSFFLYYFIAISISLFLWWSTQSYKLSLLFSCSLLIAILSLFLIIQLIFYFISKVPRPFSNALRLGMNNIVRFSSTSTIQIVSFSLVIMLSTLIFFIKDDLLTQWLKQIPQQAPNYFIINIQKSDLSTVQSFLKQKSIHDEVFYPIARGRLVKLNNVAIQLKEKNKQHNALKRDLNLTWTLQLPNDNQIVQGHWFNQTSIGQNEISVEKSLADALGFRIGDVLTFQIGEKLISATISSIRHVEWNSFQPNFYIIFPPQVIEQFPYTWLTALHLSSNQKILLKNLIQQFPNLTIFDVDFLLSEAKRLFKNLSLIIEILWSFSMSASILIFYAVLMNSLDERKQQVKILYYLGVNQIFIKKMLLAEIVIFAFIAAITGCTLAQGAAAIFAKKYFGLSLSWNLTALITAMVIASALISIIGYILLKRTVSYNAKTLN